MISESIYIFGILGNHDIIQPSS